MRMYGYLLTALALVGCGDKGDDSATDSADADGDGFTVDVDCDDGDASVSPGADELCDGIDNNCNDEIDESPTDGTSYYVDNDGDGYGDAASTGSFCSAPASGYVDNSDDCNDASPSAFPGGEELCDGVDNDCDGTIDNDTGDLRTFYADEDGDNYGDPEASIQACAAPSGYVWDSSDCDDGDAAVNPTTTWYADVDGDGYGDADGLSYTGCEAPIRYTSTVGDCNDDDGEIYPGAAERCNAADDDCDGSVPSDEFDGDGDGAPTCADDCDDTNPDVYVGAKETCDDGIDNNCDTYIDERCPETMSTSADVTIAGKTSSDYNGFSISAGDINGDGYDDLVTGAYYADNSTTTSVGEVYAFFGPISSMSITGYEADVTLSGTTQYDYFGYRMRANSDIDGDGYDDILVSAYGNDKAASTAGISYVYYGPTTSSTTDTAADAYITGVNSSDYVGYLPFETGDFDGDGDDDVIINSYYYDVGTLTSVGMFAIFDEPSGAYDIEDADITIYGASGSSYVGYSIDISGDANGDGTNDIFYGEYYNDIAYMIYGPTTNSRMDYRDADVVFVGNQSYGASQMESGDLNGDGHSDYVYGSYYDSTGASYAGGLYVFYGPITTDISVERDYDAHIYGTNSSDYLGSNLYGALAIEDLDGDGTADLIAGSSNVEQTTSIYSQGGVFLFYGPLSGDVALTDFDKGYYGTASYEYLGRDLGIGDVDADGAPDILAGAYGASSYAGSGYVLFNTSL